MNETHGVGVDSLKLFLSAMPEFSVYDYSQLELWDQCPRKYSYRYVHGLDIPVDASAVFSNAVVHPMVADFYRMGTQLFIASVVTDNVVSRKYWSEAIKKFNLARAKYGTLTNKQLAMFQVTVWKNAAYLISQQLQHDPELYKYLHHEIVYWRVLPGVPNTVWLSKPDVMLERVHDSKPVTVEVKFSSWPFNRDLNPFDRQILSQAWTTEAVLQRKIFVQVVTTPRGEWDGNEVVPDIKPPDTVLLAEWLDEIHASVEYIQQAKRTGVFPKRAPRACMDFNRMCPMVDLCRIGNGREFLMEGYDKSNPLEYLGL